MITIIEEPVKETATVEEKTISKKEDTKPVKEKVEKPVVKENPKFESLDAEDDFKA